MNRIREDRLSRLDSLYRKYNGPVPKAVLAAVDAGGTREVALRLAKADLGFWRRYLRTRLVACRNASSTGRRSRIAADIRTAWPAYRRAARLERMAHAGSSLRAATRSRLTRFPETSLTAP